MRKNFTQIFMGLALMVGFTTMSFAQCEIPPPANAIYNFQFDGGLEGWRSLDAAGFETTLGWGWNETGDLTEGSFNQPGQDNIVSESVCNGAAIMNGDFLDSGGLGSPGIGLGPCPADCNGYLVSPTMDLSAITTPIELQFTQALRHFDSEYFIYVSIDGGASNVDTIVMNAEFATFQFENAVRNIPLCDIAGETDVVITFHYQANYYFWAIDDVSILPANTTVDMRVNRNFYSKVANYITPRNMGTTHPILADIENLRAYESPASTLHFRVRDESNTEIFAASKDYGPVPGCSTDENKIFDDTYTMPDVKGDYMVEFEMDAEGDVNQDNDVLTAPFRISEREFRKLPTIEEFGSEYLTGVRYGGSFVSWGAYFHVPQNKAGQKIESVSLGIITNTDIEPSTGFINVGIYEWIDFDDIGRVNSGERILLGEVDILVEPNSPEFIQWTVTPLDENGDTITIPDDGVDGVQLLVLAHTAPFDGVTNYFFNCVADTGFEEYSAGATQLAHREADLIGGYGSFASADAASHDDRHDTRELFNIDGSYAYDIAMMLTPPPPLVGTEDLNEDLAISIFPSPASNKVNVDLSLEKISEKVSIELLDLAGNKAGVYNFSNIKKDRLTIDVSELPGGMYLMNIRTEAGMTSKKISVIH